MTRTSLVFLLQSVFVLFGLEFGSRLLLTDAIKAGERFDHFYSEQELDKATPFSRRENGGDCLKNKTGFQWNQWWGFSRKILDKECAKSLFSESKTSIVFMGGSAMNNIEAPNYLTHIDYYATSELVNVRSINLAEDGARHKNMSIRFQRDVLPLAPTAVFFLDGFNEFNSIKYKGSPADDFYWTAGVKSRVHQPLRLYIDKLIETSKFAELALLRTGLYESSRVARGEVTEEEIFSSADYYVADLQVTRVLCEAYKIKCFFLLQPHVFGSNIPEHKDIIEQVNRSFPLSEKIHVLGYERIKNRCSDCIDLSDLLHISDRTFYDPVHFSKKGSELIGKKLRSLVLKIDPESSKRSDIPRHR